MSKKPDGKQGKNGKSNKGGKNDKKIVVAKAPESKKVREPKGPVPDYKHPKVKAEVVQADINVIWNGWLGLVEHEGVRFRVAKEHSAKGDHEFSAVYVISASAGSPLEGLESDKTYIAVAALHMPTFSSKADPKSKIYDTQKRIYWFLDKAFREAKIKGFHVRPVPETLEHKHETKASASVADFDSKKQGQYCFEESSPRAIISIEPVEGGVHAPQFGNTAVAQLKIKLVSVEVGHPLSGCRIGTYLYYNAGLFAKGAPFFKGSSASDCNALYEYVAGERRRYRKSVVEMILVPSDASKGLVIGDKVTTTAQEMLKAA